mmetsp:Transcript_45271/g.106640  ORF Transcript_45271/g.106640 Transcript_45271/m.106640 type:complete len:306 (-) Transcript_45271:440-1357(-)
MSEVPLSPHNAASAYFLKRSRACSGGAEKVAGHPSSGLASQKWPGITKVAGLHFSGRGKLVRSIEVEVRVRSIARALSVAESCLPPPGCWLLADCVRRTLSIRSDASAFCAWSSEMAEGAMLAMVFSVSWITASAFDSSCFIFDMYSLSSDLSSDWSIFANSASCFASSVPLLVKRSVDIPKRHPIVTPMHAPNVVHILVERIRICPPVRLACGSPSLLKRASTVPPKHTPETSLNICPNPAAVRVERPNVTPRVESIRSPMKIITMLSMKPKPIIGTAAWMKRRRFCTSVRPRGSSSPELSSRW